MFATSMQGDDAGENNMVRMRDDFPKTGNVLILTEVVLRLYRSFAKQATNFVMREGRCGGGGSKTSDGLRL